MLQQLKQLVILLLCITFLVMGLLVNLVQVTLYLILPTTTYRQVNYYLVYSVYSYLMSLGDWWSGSKVNIFCEQELRDRVVRRQGGENVVITMNHHTELDWLYSWMVGDRLGVLGNCRVFAKDTLKWVPIIGWAWALSDVIFLRRNWEQDEANMAAKVSTLFSYPSAVWLLIFPEGTRFNSAKHAASQQFAARPGNEDLPRLQHHLLPRTKGFSFLVDKIDRTKVKYIYDVTLVEDQTYAPFTMASILGGFQTVGNMYIRRIPLDIIPRDPDGSAAWLMELFREKDELKSSFLSTGTFSTSSLPAHPGVCPPPRLAGLLLVVFSNLLVLGPLLTYLTLSSNWLVRLVFLCVMGLAWVVVNTLTSITSISQSSKYGEEAKNK